MLKFYKKKNIFQDFSVIIKKNMELVSYWLYCLYSVILTNFVIVYATFFNCILSEI